MSVLEQPHPPPIAQQNVIQQAVNATKRSWALLPVLLVIQLRAGCVQPLICNTVVPREYLEMGSEIHSSSLHLTVVRSYLRQTGVGNSIRSCGRETAFPLTWCGPKPVGNVREALHSRYRKRPQDGRLQPCRGFPTSGLGVIRSPQPAEPPKGYNAGSPEEIYGRSYKSFR